MFIPLFNIMRKNIIFQHFCEFKGKVWSWQWPPECFFLVLHGLFTTKKYIQEILCIFLLIKNEFLQEKILISLRGQKKDLFFSSTEWPIIHFGKSFYNSPILLPSSVTPHTSWAAAATTQTLCCQDYLKGNVLCLWGFPLNLKAPHIVIWLNVKKTYFVHLL